MEFEEARSARAGLRERKKHRTREAIADAALRLFLERGFDAVSVAEIAEAADVADRTVYNYFPSKDDLVFDRMEAFESALLAAIRDRSSGESVLAAFRRFLLTRSERLETKAGRDAVAAAARLIGGSLVLQARERAIIDRYTEALAELIVDETGAGPDDVEPLIAANALMGVHRTLLDHARRSAPKRARGASLATDTRATAARAFALLERGLGDYAVKG
jgi:AcrR family transcriptional regulator